MSARRAGHVPANTPASSGIAEPGPPGRGALPVDLSTFVGREDEIGALRGLVPESRLLTLTGAGGTGKSRLAAEVVRSVAEELGLDLAWVELAAIDDAALIPKLVAEACGLREEVRGADPRALAEMLRGRRLLLILDNCEHLVERCAELADVILRSCPQLRIVTTSREALGISGERAWLVPPLCLPPADERDLGVIGRCGAVQLFRERARHASSSWELTEATAPTVAEICRRLDGIPLAIELAAARVRVLSVEEIRDRLGDAFRLLTAGGRTSLPRHRTLRATMEWSHDLLGDDDKVLLRRLSVFRGGLSLEAVERVAAFDGIDALEVLDVLARLVDRSLVSVREQAGQTRYSLLETVRMYAADRLESSGEDAEVRRRHADWIADLIRTAEPHLTRSDRPAWVARLVVEIDNVREALVWTRASDRALHVDLVGRLCWFWFSTQHWMEAARWIGEALELPEASTPGLPRAKLLFAAGALGALRAGGDDARALLEEAAKLAADAGDSSLEAYALNYVGMTWAGQGDPRGAAFCERAAEWFEADGDLYGLRLALLLMGTAALVGGDLDLAEERNLAGVRVARRFGLDRELAVSLQNLAVVYLTSGDLDRAEPAVREGLAAARRDPAYYFIASGLQYMAEIIGHRGDALEAARILGASDAARNVIGAPPFHVDGARLDRAVVAFRSLAGGEAFDAARAEGRRLSPLDAIDRVLGGGRAETRADLSDADTGASPVAEAPPPGRAPAVPGADGRSAGLGSALRVRALGCFEVEVWGEPIESDAWRYVKPRELLVFLLLNPRGRTRDQIADALWPGAAPERASNSFHVTLHHLRKALGRPEWIERDGDRYRLAASVGRWFDVEELEKALTGLRRGSATHGDLPGAPTGDEAISGGEAERIRSGLSLYSGDLMEGEAVGPWIESHRDRLRSLYVDGALALGRVLEAGDRWDEALDLYAATSGREELNEELHRRMMTCWAQAGDRQRALRHYTQLEKLLRSALDAEPEGATRALAERLRSA